MPWKSKYLPGMKFGRWEIVERDLSKKRPTKFLCKCDCGNISSLFMANLVRGFSTQCTNCQGMSRSKDLIGKKYNKFTVLSLKKVNGKTRAEVLCDCGEIRFLSPYRVKNGLHKSCGCSVFKTGSKIGLLKIKLIINSDEYLCECECGKELKCRKHHLKTDYPSCGCFRKNIRIEEAKKKVGLKWGYLRIKKFIGMKKREGKSRASYLLKCKCGNEFEQCVGRMYLIRSCGCLRKDSSPKGQNHHLSKLSNDEVKSIRDFFKSGLYSRKELAEMIGISYDVIYEITIGKTWKHLL